METNPKTKFEIDILHDIHDLETDNVDVFVTLENGSKFTATFFTLKNINRIMNRYKDSGECANGIYFWASDMIIIESLNLLSIRITIENLLESEEFDSVFLKIEDHEE